MAAGLPASSRHVLGWISVSPLWLWPLSLRCRSASQLLCTSAPVWDAGLLLLSLAFRAVGRLCMQFAGGWVGAAPLAVTVLPCLVSLFCGFGRLHPAFSLLPPTSLRLWPRPVASRSLLWLCCFGAWRHGGSGAAAGAAAQAPGVHAAASAPLIALFWFELCLCPLASLLHAFCASSRLLLARSAFGAACAWILARCVHTHFGSYCCAVGLFSGFGLCRRFFDTVV